MADETKVEALGTRVAKLTRATLRSSGKRTRSKDGTTATITVDAAKLDALEVALTAWDDAAHEAVTAARGGS